MKIRKALLNGVHRYLVDYPHKGQYVAKCVHGMTFSLSRKVNEFHKFFFKILHYLLFLQSFSDTAYQCSVITDINMDSQGRPPLTN